jgi:acetylornithine deacetylase/succinyl-diaminopimelate desuccinylase-like protein
MTLRGLTPQERAAVVETIDAEALARDTLAFVETTSETGDEGPGSAFLAQLLEREGFAVEEDAFLEGRPNIYARVAGTGGGRCLAFNGHTDTIPVGACHAPGRDGDWILGRGTEDMKGGLVAMVHGAAALRRAGIDLAGDLWLTGVVGHETPVGRKEGPKRLIEHLRSGRIPAEAIVIVEGPCAVWAASLGSAMFTVKAVAEREPIHTIKVPYADNPARWIGALLAGFERLEATYEAGVSHPLCGRHQLNVGIVRGGDWFNRLPVEWEVTGTRRWTPGTTVDEAREEMETLCAELAERSGLRFEVTLANDREPFETPADHPLVTALLDAGEADRGARPEIVGMGLVGDANLYANDGGVPTVYYGPEHRTAHSDEERVDLGRLVHCARVYADGAAAFCGVAG